ncbi:hypothetical protein [Nitrosomonas sp. Nm58]|uniref:hypothetical protein n=1 Tax=Nitrosomonas sp. Nm58 TaxID=200126 RepID=UPI00115FC7A0|nr:hypothetical protein [Nitrosomonas sp. Nm58]
MNCAGSVGRFDPPRRCGFRVAGGVQPSPSGAHSWLLRGSHGAGIGVVIRRAPGGPWKGDSVEIILPKPNTTLPYRLLSLT